MPRFREQTMTISISYTTDGEIINRITSSSSDGTNATEVLTAYLEQFGGLKIQPVNKAELRRDIEAVVDKHLSYDREANNA